MVAMDQGLFDKSGRRLSPGKSIHHDLNSATVNKLNELGQNASALMAHVEAKGVTEHIQGLGSSSHLPPKLERGSKTKGKVSKQKLARMENAKTRVLQKVLPLVDHDNIDITCGVEDIFIAALVSLPRREAKVLHDTLKSDN